MTAYDSLSAYDSLGLGLNQEDFPVILYFTLASNDNSADRCSLVPASDALKT